MIPSASPARRAPALPLAAAAMAIGLAATAMAARGASDAPGVVVAPAERRDVTPRFFYVGRVEAVETVELVARVDHGI